MMKTYPSTTAGGLIAAQKYHANLTSTPFNSPLYNNIYNNIFTGKNRAYIGTPTEQSSFYISQKQYYYSNICQFDKELLTKHSYNEAAC
jgi:hypothetical protein